MVGHDDLVPRLVDPVLAPGSLARLPQPVLVLDDVFAELDTGRRERLASLVQGAEQVLVTAAVPGDVPEQLLGGRYDVHDGQVTRVR